MARTCLDRNGEKVINSGFFAPIENRQRNAEPAEDTEGDGGRLGNRDEEAVGINYGLIDTGTGQIVPGNFAKLAESKRAGSSADADAIRALRKIEDVQSAAPGNSRAVVIG